MYTSARIVYEPQPNRTATVEELNEALYKLHIPAIIFVVTCIIIGCIGNSMVIYIYKTKFRRSNHRYFILFLGVMDLLANLTGMPFLVASLRLPYLITSAITCKSFRYFHYFVNNSAGLLLVVIAIERFRKICHPFKKQLTHKNTLYLCWGTILFSAIMALPAPVLFGPTEIDTGIDNITGSECYSREPAFEIYQAALMIETIVSVCIFAVLYGFIIRKLWTNDQFLQAMRSIQSRASNRSGQDTSSNGKEFTDDFDSYDHHSVVANEERASDDSAKPLMSPDGETIRVQQNDKNLLKPTQEQQLSASCHAINSINRKPEVPFKPTQPPRRMSKELPNGKTQPKEKNGIKRSLSDGTLNRVGQPNKRFQTVTPTARLAYGNLLKDNQTQPPENTLQKKHKNSSTTIRVTLMLFSVSLAFVISFIPHLSLMLVTSEDEGFLDSLSKTGVMVYQVFLRIFILNNVINPIIYLFCDTKFRQECKKVCSFILCFRSS